jgi:hypothetical protein
MRIFMIEAYGGMGSTDGAIHHFSVQAKTTDEAIDIVRCSEQGQQYQRFEATEQSADIEAGEPGIIGEGNGPSILTG